MLRDFLKNRNRNASMKEALIIASVIISLISIVFYFLITQSSVRKNINELEKYELEHQSEVILNEIYSKCNDTFRVANDYGFWDEAFQKSEENDTQFFKENYSEWLPSNQNINLILVLGSEKNILDSYGLEAGKLMNNKWIDLTIGKNLNVTYQAFEKKYTRGLIKIDRKMYVVAVCPIMKINRILPSNGVVIIGKLLNEYDLKELENKFGYNLSLYIDSKTIEGDVPKEKINKFYENITAQKSKIYQDSKYSFISIPVFNNLNEKEADLLIGKSNDKYISTYNTITGSAIKASILALILTSLFGFLFSKMVTSPLFKFEKKIKIMMQNGILEEVNISSTREIKVLFETFNSLVETIHIKDRNEELLKEKSIIDNLTGLYNHKYFYESMESTEILNKGIFSILFIDIDYFKLVNDNFGHSTGDSVLKRISELIKETTGRENPVFRYGGEEFTAILRGFDSEKALEFAERIRSKVSTDFELQKFSGFVPISVSVGIASHPQNGIEFEDLVKKADKAMYFSKNQGRNQCRNYFEGIEEHFDARTSDFKQDSAMNTAFALSAAINAKDSYTEEHSEEVMKYSMLLAEKLGFDSKQRYNLRLGSLLHDCGKIGVPDNILNKSIPLDDDEWKIIRNHTVIGANIVKFLVDSEDVVNSVYSHHERWDGSGYPDGKKGKEISIYARIISIADSYNAMVTDRPYRQALSEEKAVEQLLIFKTKQFDPVLVDMFIKIINENSQN